MSGVFAGLAAVAGLLLIVFVVTLTHSVLKRRRKQRYGDKEIPKQIHTEHTIKEIKNHLNNEQFIIHY